MASKTKNENIQTISSCGTIKSSQRLSSRC
ncbi:unnamed protein product [Strongylus vulgaris]|uniref:Uncharacterized protein n=1 Tax=Strongylus vulgaris TaxID=40348 RepID=A0A3P7JGX6_STRVU|nr:unnamed protein product [Strongylus vulgaris]